MTGVKKDDGRALGAIRPMVISDSPFRFCQWIEGEPRDREFCGKPTYARTSWCRAHLARIYRPPERNERSTRQAQRLVAGMALPR